MNKSILLLLKSCPDALQVDLDEFQEVAQKVGINVLLKEKENEHYLYISYDPTQIDRKISRNAGPKLKRKPEIRPTCGEVRKFQENMSNKELCEKLGYSTATFYRRLTDMSKKNKSDDEFF